ncbi:bifunctional fructose-bisphosphatase/inositol-phosphate phosphatase [Methanobacterium petrolearium]|uniref:bifunctional fructose-bisphosphatase/inositol-phosphate phosphatase n=1 Tax=Methanobacterium petrolearium TaxID=710190 RepID=UPI001AEB8564|nr:bifunctional fructose-bisphosphatase/inositol-phosphate phosphatase [Methanobacterium petrolearium]MBP1946384.1 myo-inositol-1(or 4)-monophosphatase [Methanobacterium petrolearium]BDZ70593.1 inositol monophosphatase [Methanobacterium petrolearium]
MDEKDREFWTETCQELIKESQNAISPLIGSLEGSEIVKTGADGTPTMYIDIVAEKKVIEVLESIDKPLTLISEEIGQVNLGKGQPEVVMVVDPLDGTSNAVKNIPAYGISVAVAPIPTNQKGPLTVQDIQMGFVKNYATDDFYAAFKGQGALVNGKNPTPSSKQDLSQISLGAYVYRMNMGKVEKLCKSVRRMRILGAVAIEISYVADGTYDAFVDVRDNLRLVDLAAAKLILEESGGIVTDRYGKALNGKLNVMEKTSMIATCNSVIHQEIVRIVEGIK